MTILVTGGAGFIGSNFILDWLSENDEPVINLDKLTYAGNIQNLKSVSERFNYHFIRGDIADTQLVYSILDKYRPRAIINFAAETHVDKSIKTPSNFVATNIVGTFNLLESIYKYWQTLDGLEKENFRLVHISTDEVYGTLDVGAPAFTENSLYAPNSPYSASKASSDHLVRSYHQTYGLPVLTTHCSNNYGPYQYPEKLIPFMISQAIDGKSLTIYGDGQHIRDWLYVGDHCAAIRELLQKGRVGEVYNIGASTEKTNIQIVELLCAILDRECPRGDGISYASQISFVNDRPGHDRRYAINSQKIGLETGWAPIHKFDEALIKTVRWYLNNKDWIANTLSQETYTE